MTAPSRPSRRRSSCRSAPAVERRVRPLVPAAEGRPHAADDLGSRSRGRLIAGGDRGASLRPCADGADAPVAGDARSSHRWRAHRRGRAMRRGAASRCSRCPRWPTPTITPAPSAIEFDRRRWQAAGILAALSGAAPRGRSLSRRRGVAVARSALGGAGAVMVHYTRVQGLTDLPTEAAEVARAARDVGVRVGFARRMRDRNPLVYGPPSRPGRAAAGRARRDRAAASFARRCRSASRSRWSTRSRRPPAVRCSTCSTARTACNGAATSCSPRSPRPRAHRPAHAHAPAGDPLLSAIGPTPTIPSGIVRYLDEHRPLSAAADARPLHLGAARRAGTDRRSAARRFRSTPARTCICSSGIAPVDGDGERGCRVALGLDGSALDEDDDALREMRLAHLLHEGNGFAIDSIARRC